MTLRTYDASVFNRLANDPAVIGTIGHDPSAPPVSFDAFIEDRDKFAFFSRDDDGGFVFEWRGPGIWEAHMMFLPAARGRKAITDGRAIIHEMFTLWEARTIWGQIPLSNRGAHLYCHQIGAEFVGLGNSHLVGPVRYFRNDAEPWLKNNADKFRTL